MFLNIQQKSDFQIHTGYDPTEIGLVLLLHQSLNSNQSCSDVSPGPEDCDMKDTFEFGTDILKKKRYYLYVTYVCLEFSFGF